MRETPLDVIEHFARMHRGDAESIEGSGAVVEEQNVRTRVFAVSGVDALVFAVVDPKTVENDRHARESGRGAEFVASGVLGPIHRDPSKRPLFRAGGRSVDAIPTVDMNS